MLAYQVQLVSISHENFLARTVLNTSNFLWMAKRVALCDLCSHYCLDQPLAKGKVHRVNSNIYKSVNINVKDILKTMAFSTNIKLEKRMWLCPLADHRKWHEFKTVPVETISRKWVLKENFFCEWSVFKIHNKNN